MTFYAEDLYYSQRKYARNMTQDSQIYLPSQQLTLLHNKRKKKKKKD